MHPILGRSQLWRKGVQFGAPGLRQAYALDVLAHMHRGKHGVSWPCFGMTESMIMEVSRGCRYGIHGHTVREG